MNDFRIVNRMFGKTDELKNQFHLDEFAPIIAGQTIGGLILGQSAVSLEHWLKAHSRTWSAEPKVEEKNVYYFDRTFQVGNLLEFSVDLFTAEVFSIRALHEYKGKFLDKFQPGQFTLRDLTMFDPTFEHMTNGYIMSCNHMGVGFLLPNDQVMEDQYHYVEECTQVADMEFLDFTINGIEIMPEYYDGNRIWDYYEPYLPSNEGWQEGFKPQ